MVTCENCGGTDFDIEAGRYFCQNCLIQSQDSNVELSLDHSSTHYRLRGSRKRRCSSDTSLASSTS